METSLYPSVEFGRLLRRNSLTWPRRMGKMMAEFQTQSSSLNFGWSWTFSEQSKVYGHTLKKYAGVFSESAGCSELTLAKCEIRNHVVITRKIRI